MACILLAAFAYLAGSVPAAWIAGKLRGFDLRKEGSGNSGATNALRVLGKGPAAAVLAFDLAKGFFAVLLLPAWLQASAGSGIEGVLLAKVLAGAACVLGHVFPVWLGFRGGKGVATGAAVAAALAPFAALVCLAAFLAVAAAARYVSLASMTAAVLLPLAYAIIYRGAAFSPAVFGFCLAATALVLASHRKNLVRLLRGEEPKLGERKSDA